MAGWITREIEAQRVYVTLPDGPSIIGVAIKTPDDLKDMRGDFFWSLLCGDVEWDSDGERLFVGDHCGSLEEAKSACDAIFGVLRMTLNAVEIDT